MSSPDAKSKILARRARFIAAAIGSAGLIGCSGDDSSAPTVCLTVDAAADTPADTNPGPCLTAPVDSSVSDAPAEAAVCLSAPFDSGVDTTADGTSEAATDTGPSVCLSPALDGG